MLRAILNWIASGTSKLSVVQPEANWVVLLVDDLIVVRTPDAKVERVRIPDLQAVYVETNDSGPWGIDVWWILEGRETQCIYPLGATGENEVLAELKKLPGFEVKGMNSAENRRILCWKASS
jgi:hypothetical protein